MRKILFVLLSIYAFTFFFHWQLPASTEVAIKPLPMANSSILVPLDSRPVCTRLPKSLAALAGTNLILPPNDLLDNYRMPAKNKKIMEWLKENITSDNNVYLSGDLLLSGGLIHARKAASTASAQDELLEELILLRDKTSSCSYFQVIPRLLVSDELIPDRWYKYRLMKFSQLYDMVEIFNDYDMTNELLAIKEKIPKEVLNKYYKRYASQDKLNERLLQLVNDKFSLTIGQDDSLPFGLPRRSAALMENNLQKKGLSLKQAAVVYGADEIAASLIARNYLEKRQLKPSIYVQYADASISNLIMPYMPVSVEGILKEKLSFLNATRVHDKSKADIILYVNCGHDKYRPGHKQALELLQLLNTHQHVALIDLSANFEEYELLMPQALKYNIPINRLCAFSGWNTFSNSTGTALAQAVILAVRLNELKTPSEKLQLRTQNLAFTVERLLDDYIYQKKLHASLKKELLMRGIDPTELNPHDHAYAQALAQFFLRNQAIILLHTNLGKTPYYEDAYGKYYLKDLSFSATLPWSRIFEISITPKLIIGKN